jgi:hypothetical protein
MNLETTALVLGWVGIACWVVCFWWMHRLSSRQQAMLEKLHAMTTRIERLSKVEHDLIRELHPQVGEIKNKVDDVVDAVSNEAPSPKRSTS